MRRILLLIKGLGPGGAERLLVNAAPFADRGRFDYGVAYLVPGQAALRPELEEAGLPVTCLDGAAGAGWLWRLRRLVEERGIALVHAHSPYAAAGARLALPRRLPLVYTEHDTWPAYRRATAVANALTYGRNSHVFAVSDRVRGSIRRPRVPVETLLHGADPRIFGQAPDRDALRREFGVAPGAPVIGTVANYRPEKGHRHLLAAAVRVREALPEARFVLVGGGPLEADVRREARELGLEGTVVFAAPRHEAARVAAAFDVFVLASLHEGLPISVLEAMALGRPVVVTDAGGTTEVVTDRVNGLVVPPGDAGALAEGILELLGDPGLAGRLGEAARRRSADFDIRRTVRRMEEVYEELLA